MADVQLQKGHVQLANRLLEAIVDADFTGAQLKILLALFRLTYGWRKRTVGVSIAEIARLSRLSPTGGFRRAFDDLVANNVVLELRDGQSRFYAIQKDFEHWGIYGATEERLRIIWSRKPRSNDRLMTTPEFDPVGSMVDDDSQPENLTLQGETSEKGDITRQGEATSPARVKGTRPNSFGDETCERPKERKERTSTTPSTDLDPILALARSDQNPHDPIARFIASRHSASRDEWKREIASMRLTYGDLVVDQVCRDALLADKPITGAYAFRAFCATARREPLAMHGLNGSSSSTKKGSERNDDVLRRFATDDDHDQSPPPDEDDHG